MQYSNANVIISTTKFSKIILDLSEKRISKLNCANIKSNKVSKFSGFAIHIRIEMLHRLHPRLKFWNDILDSKTRYELFFVLFKMVHERNFSFSKTIMQNQVNICNSTFTIFAWA